MKRLTYFHPKMRGNVEKKPTQSTSDLSPKHQTSELSENITCNVMLKYQKWQHWCQCSRASGAVSRLPQPNWTFVSS